MNLNKFKELLSVPTKTYKESKMVEYLISTIGDMDGVTLTCDEHNNIYAVKGTLGEGEFYPMFISHTDTVHELVDLIDVKEEFYRLDIGRELTTLLPKKETLPKDQFHAGDYVKVYVSEVEMKGKWPKVFVSRTHNNLIIKLLENLIPEIKEGIIEIMGISREPGDRAKIGLKTNDPKVDPIGACVGEGGARIKEIVRALSDEKIDLFRWSDNEHELIANALQPAEVVAVTNINPKDKTALAIVPDDQLSLAIGKLGQNVKLAVQACGWSIDIKSEQNAAMEGILY